MRCMVCGSEIPDGSPFCNVCNATMPQSAKLPVIPNRRMGAVQADGTAPSMGAEPSYGGRPLMGAEPPYGGRQPMGAEPPYGVKTPFDERPPMGSDIPDGGRPPMGQGPSNGKNPPPGGRTANSPRPKDDKTKASGGGTNKALLITLIVLLAVCVIGLGVGTVFFVKQVKKADQLTADKNALESSVQALETENAEMKNTVETFEEEKAAWDEEKETLNSDISEKETEIRNIRAELNQAKSDLQSEQEKTASLQSQLNEQSNNAAKVGEVYNRIDQLDEPDGTYYANRNVVVMKKGEGVSLAVHFSHTSSCKISYKGSNADVCTGEWSDSWFDNNNSIYLNLRAGYTTGYSILTFSNNINSSTFQVVVFVID